jgi:hypothetical protein
MRPLHIISAIVALIIGLYTATWFYAANNVKKITSVVLEKSKKEGVEVEYTNITSSGFPFKLNTVVSDLKVIIDGKKIDSKSEDIIINYSTKGDLAIGSSIFSDKVIIDLPKVLSFNLKDSRKNAENIGNLSFDTQFEDKATIEIQIVGSNLFMMALTKNNKSFDIKNIKRISYYDNGSRTIISDTQNGDVEQVSKGSNANFIYNETNEKRLIKLDINGTSEIVKADNEKIKFGETEFNLSVDADVPADNDFLRKYSKISINNFDFITPKFGFKTKGEIIKEEKAFIPVGYLTMNVNNYKDLVVAFSDAFFESLKKNGKNYTTEQKQAIYNKVAGLLLSVSENPQDLESKNLVITISRNAKSADVKVGTLNAQHILQVFDNFNKDVSVIMKDSQNMASKETKTVTPPAISEVVKEKTKAKILTNSTKNKVAVKKENIAKDTKSAADKLNEAVKKETKTAIEEVIKSSPKAAVN